MVTLLTLIILIVFLYAGNPTLAGLKRIADPSAPLRNVQGSLEDDGQGRGAQSCLMAMRRVVNQGFGARETR
jgi:hypothetical protein